MPIIFDWDPNFHTLEANSRLSTTHGANIVPSDNEKRCNNCQAKARITSFGKLLSS